MLSGGKAYAAGCTEHDFQWISLSATCTEPGYQGYRCSVCSQTWQMESVPELGHDYSAWTTMRQATCESDGQRQRTCRRCGFLQDDPIEALPHTFVDTVKKATCRTDGYTVRNCIICGYETRTDYVQAPGHKYTMAIIAPECTEGGYTRYHCVNCGDLVHTAYTDPVGHSFDTGVLTGMPTSATRGVLTYTCQECDYTYTEYTPTWDGAFVDVNTRSYYFPAVLWAVDMGITQGTDARHFSPNQVCTRAQVITFLWREAGEPRPKTTASPFSDVSSGAYYHRAVLWAVEQGITQGVDAAHFAPNDPCTRCQVMTFIYRSKGSDTATGTLAFTDVRTTDYFYNAVRWAYQKRITVGTTATQFSPHDTCTRAQIVTFLFRAKDT